MTSITTELEGHLTPALIAGVLSGVAGLLVFLVIHHLWIAPIWFILPMGLVIASAGGLAMGWAYLQLLPRLPHHPWSILAWVGLLGVILAPSILLAELRSPLYDISGGEPRLTVSNGRAVTIFVIELLLTATAAGGLAGWLIGHTGRAAMATALAGFVFALGPGHNIPFLGSTPGAGKGVALLAAIILASAVVLVEAYLVMTGGRPTR